MTRGFEAIISLTVDASRAEVWDALTNPAKVKQYLHGTEMSTDWREGSPIFWRGEWKGKPYEDKGKILEVKAQRMIKYTHWSPLGGSEDKPEHYHTLTYELAGYVGNTTLTLTHDNNPTPEEAPTTANETGRTLLRDRNE